MLLNYYKICDCNSTGGCFKCIPFLYVFSYPLYLQSEDFSILGGKKYELYERTNGHGLQYD